MGAISRNRESEFYADVAISNRQTKLGKVFISSTIFTLPNGGKRSPDVAWIANKCCESLSIEEQEKFPIICSDFVIELRYSTDSLSQLREKMHEYLRGCLKIK